MLFFPLIPAIVSTVAMIVIATVKPAHMREMIAADVVAGIATMVAISLIVAVRRRSTITVVQAALGATVGQMMLCVLLGAGAWALELAGDLQIFPLWLLAFYWIELVTLALMAIRLIRQAKPGGPDVPMDRTVKCL